MNCPACGKTLSRRMKYCNHCGEPLSLEKDAATEKSEARFDEYVEGIFWTAVFGLGLILGGMVLMKEVLHLSRGWIIAYMAMSSMAFMIIFGIHLWQIVRMTRTSKEANDNAAEEQFETNKLGRAKPPLSLDEAISITEDPTHRLETRPKEEVRR